MRNDQQTIDNNIYWRTWKVQQAVLLTRLIILSDLDTALSIILRYKHRY